MVGVIDGFRWAILGETNINWPAFALSIVITFLITAYAIRYFRKMEKSFADVI
jgi:lipopolysaccharide transport system permease protein